MQFIDAVGNLYSDIGPEEVLEHFDHKGFFAYASKATRKVSDLLCFDPMQYCNQPLR